MKHSLLVLTAIAACLPLGACNENCLLNCDDASPGSALAANATPAETPVIVDPQSPVLTSEQVRKIADLKPSAKTVRAGAVAELGLPFRQRGATPQSDLVYEYRLEDPYIRLVLGFRNDGSYVGYGFLYGFKSHVDTSL
jgi:hypothetical protein